MKHWHWETLGFISIPAIRETHCFQCISTVKCKTCSTTSTELLRTSAHDQEPLLMLLLAGEGSRICPRFLRLQRCEVQQVQWRLVLVFVRYHGSWTWLQTIFLIPADFSKRVPLTPHYWICIKMHAGLKDHWGPSSLTSTLQPPLLLSAKRDSTLDLVLGHCKHICSHFVCHENISSRNVEKNTCHLDYFIIHLDIIDVYFFYIFSFKKISRTSLKFPICNSFLSFSFTKQTFQDAATEPKPGGVVHVLQWRWLDCRGYMMRDVQTRSEWFKWRGCNMTDLMLHIIQTNRLDCMSLSVLFSLTEGELLAWAGHSNQQSGLII